MRRRLAAVIFLGASLAPTPATAEEPTAEEFATARTWIDSRFTARAEPRPPFSFTYGDERSSELLPTWRKDYAEQPIDAARTERAMRFTDPRTDLRVECTATVYRDFPAVDWVVKFTNAGTDDTPILSAVLPLDAMVVACGQGMPGVLFHSRGSKARIDDFEPLRTVLASDEIWSGSSFGGRSSDGVLPFFKLVGRAAGASIDVGWSGDWSAEFRVFFRGQAVARIGQRTFHAKLRPGESIRTPSIVVHFWDKKDPERGGNLHRRFLRKHFTPTVAGQPVDPPIAASPHATIGFEKTTEANMLRQIANVARHGVGFDYWWIDAGWYTCGDNWARYVGNVDPDPARFPSGLKPVADAAHAAGMRFLLWNEPERVMPGTWLHKNHPEWLIAPPEGMPADLQYQRNDGFHLLDLGNPEALAWSIEHYSKMIAATGIECFRNDFNMYPGFYWNAAEPADRVGLREARYVTGLYRLFDALRGRHPGLMIDDCASGGRRIDVEMLRRALVLTRSDYLWDPVGQQAHTFGLARWIPITGIGAASVDVYSRRSGLGNHFTLAADYDSQEPVAWDAIRATVAEYRALKPYYEGDFHPLGAYSVAEDAWMAWQFDRPEQGDGLVQAFRRKACEVDASIYKLRGLEPDAEYEVVNRDAADRTVRSGRSLRDEGFKVTIAEKPGAAVYSYRKVGR
nr:alpha-galactosidase [Paludisphaera mucosa]